MMTDTGNKESELPGELAALHKLGNDWLFKRPVVSREFEGCEGTPVAVQPGHVWPYIFYAENMFKQALQYAKQVDYNRLYETRGPMEGARVYTDKAITRARLFGAEQASLIETTAERAFNLVNTTLRSAASSRAISTLEEAYAARKEMGRFRTGLYFEEALELAAVGEGTIDFQVAGSLLQAVVVGEGTVDRLLAQVKEPAMQRWANGMAADYFTEQRNWGKAKYYTTGTGFAKRVSIRLQSLTDALRN